MRYHFIRSALEDGMLVLENILRSLNLADMMTKTITEKLKLCATSVNFSLRHEKLLAVADEEVMID